MDLGRLMDRQSQIPAGTAVILQLITLTVDTARWKDLRIKCRIAFFCTNFTIVEVSSTINQLTYTLLCVPIHVHYDS